MALRLCEDCGWKMEPGTPRQRVDGDLLCASCAQKRGETVDARQASLRVEAHDSGDGETIYHCPFCGSGQVIARSDRTIECEFCHVNFTVQVQPQFPSFPQTIDGQPVQVPGMPGQVGVDPSGAGMPPDAGAPVDEGQVDDQGNVPPQFGGDEEDQGDEEPENGDDDSAEEQEEEEDNAPPWAKKSYRTLRGDFLTEEEYIRHIAISAADPSERVQVLARVKASRP
jgi:hypothetical protein